MARASAEQRLTALASSCRLVRLLPYVPHAVVATWLFADSLFRGQLLFFRDVSIYYYPNYVFLERALHHGVWPLWNPSSDAGAPFLIAYPLDLLMVLLLGAKGALLLSPPLHVLLAMCGASALARRLGAGPWGAWAAGAFFGASGYVLSSVNLFELFHGVAWAPWVLAALMAVFRSATARSAAVLGVLGAVQVSTLAAETILQTALAGLCLLPRVPMRRDWWRLWTAACLAALVAAPVLFGTRALLEGTRRAEGLTPQEAFAWSATPMVLVEAAIPRLFGNVHTFTDWGFWGQPFFSGGFPYILSLYLGPVVLVLALWSGRGHGRLWLLGLLGVLLALGSHGPLESLLAPLLKHFRAPAKFLLLPTLALALLAGRGVDRAVRERLRRPLLSLAPAALLALVGFGVSRWPDLPARALGGVLPELREAHALVVARDAWPRSFAVTGVLGLGAGLALCAGPRLAPLAAVLGLLDLLIVNTGLNPTTRESFYERSPELASLLGRVELREPYRWFSYGVANTPGLSWSLAVARPNSDVPLYYMERQSLLPRTHVLDGLEAAFDEELGLFAPRGSALRREERTPSLFPDHYTRLRLANVRWVLSFRDLPADLVTRLGEAAFPEILRPLALYEVRDPLPRAYWVGRAEVVPDAARRLGRLEDPAFDPRQVVLLAAAPPAANASEAADAGPSSVVYEAVDPHTVRLRVDSPPGFVVVLDGFHRDWLAEGPHGLLPVLEANGRYRAIPTAGGHLELTLHYRPSWLRPALAGVLVGVLLILAISRPIKVFRPRST